MTDKIDKNQNISKNNKLSRQAFRNVRIQNKKAINSENKTTQDAIQHPVQEVPVERPSDSPKIDTKNTIDNTPDISEPKPSILDNENVIQPQKSMINEPHSEAEAEAETKIKKPSRESLRDKQYVNRKKRRERHEKRKQELLQSALSKLKTYNNNDTDSLKALEESLAHNMSPRATETHIQTSVSEQDILANGTQKTPEKSESPKAQSAKDRFKNALKKISTAIAVETKSENNDAVIESPHELAFKKKLQERNRIKKMVTEYLENMGLSYPQGNFQMLCNNITDTLLLSIEAIPQKNKKRIEQLQKRAELPIRTGNNILNLKPKKTKASEIVGDLFSLYDIDSKKDKIILKSTPTKPHITLPTDNFDTIRENLFMHSLLDMSDVQNFMIQNFTENNDAFEKHTDEVPKTGLTTQDNTQQKTVNASPPHYVKHSAPIQHNMKLKDLIQKNIIGSKNTTQNLNDLKSRLQKLS